MARKTTKTKAIRSALVHLGAGADKLLEGAVRVTDAGAAALPARNFTAYAPPMIWGPDTTVASHIGTVTFTITYEAVGDTLVMGRVTYYKGPDAGQLVTEEFRDETTITTSNSVANVVCNFKGIPTGSAVNGTVTP
jgi:hypothetical protein